MTWPAPQIPAEVTEEQPENTVASWFPWNRKPFRNRLLEANIQDKHRFNCEGKRLEEGSWLPGSCVFKEVILSLLPGKQKTRL